MITLVLFVPFLFVSLIVGLIYFRAGYKRGLWRALISLGATAVATVIALLLANLIAGLLSGVVAGLIPESTFDSMGIVKGLAKSVLTGLVQDVLSMLLFGIILIIFLIVCKIIANRILPNKLKVEHKGLKWGGLGVRALDTVLVTLLILLPLYGTMAAYVTPAAKIAEMSMGKDSSVVMILKQLSNHPVVSMYKFGPTNWVYDGLSGFSVGDAELDLPKVAETVDVTMQKLDKFNNATTNEDRMKACKELTDHLKNNVVSEDWFYEVAKEASAEFEKQLQNATTPQEAKEAQMYLEIFSAPKEEFQDCSEKILEFISYAMDSEFMEFTEENNYEVLTDNFHEELGETLNHGPQTRAIKRMILVSAAETLFRTQYNACGMSEDEKTISQAANEFVDQYMEGRELTEEQQNQEAEAITIMYFESNPLAIVEAFARHPLFGYKSVEPFMTNAFLAEAMSGGENVEQTRMMLEMNPAIRQGLIEKVKACETAPLSKDLLHDHADLVMNQ
ncbi:MAG: CvpA family protein [Clostridia bacterium]|nr:CvpA family protein [Clostridia bacterium]